MAFEIGDIARNEIDQATNSSTSNLRYPLSDYNVDISSTNNNRPGDLDYWFRNHMLDIYIDVWGLKALPY